MKTLTYYTLSKDGYLTWEEEFNYDWDKIPVCFTKEDFFYWIKESTNDTYTDHLLTVWGYENLDEWKESENITEPFSKDDFLRWCIDENLDDFTYFSAPIYTKDTK